MKNKVHFNSIFKRNQFNRKYSCILLVMMLLFQPLIYAQDYVQLGNDIDGQIVSEQSGLATSLSADGKRIAVGSSFSGNSQLSPGLVRVYEIENEIWTQVGQDIIGENTEDEFGTSVSLSADGSVVAIGAPENDGGASRAGHIRIYEFANGQWAQMGADLDGDDMNEGFGSSICLSADGQKVISGARFGRTNGIITGNARVYEFANGNWSQLGDDLGSTIANESYGWSVSMSSDGLKVAVGAPLNDSGGFNFGRVEVLEWVNNEWVVLGNSIAGTIEAGASGITVNLNGEGDRVVIGASACGAPETQGTAQVYEFSGSNWNPLGNLISGTNPLSCFATSVDMNAEGNRVVVGDPLQGPNGLTRVFKLDAGTWTQVGTDILGELQGDLSGRSVSISDSGAQVSMGANVNSDGVQSGGQARVFQDDSLLDVTDFTQGDTEINIYPSPTNDILQVESVQSQQIKEVVIYDLSGRLVLEKQPQEGAKLIPLNVSELRSGIYQMVLTLSEEQRVVKRFVKK